MKLQTYSGKIVNITVGKNIPAIFYTMYKPGGKKGEYGHIILTEEIIRDMIKTFTNLLPPNLERST
jgi:hypothetical protein